MLGRCPGNTERWLFLLQFAVIFNNLAVPFVGVPLSPIQMLICECNYICFASLHSQHGSKYFTQLWTTLQDEYIKDWKGKQVWAPTVHVSFPRLLKSLCDNGLFTYEY